MKELVERIARALVDDPDAVTVTEIESEEGPSAVFELRVGPDDLGKVIGKQGRTARAMRVLLAAAVLKQGRRAGLEIVE